MGQAEYTAAQKFIRSSSQDSDEKLVRSSSQDSSQDSEHSGRLDHMTDYSTWYTKQAAADRLGVSTKTIEKYAETHAFFISEECTQAAIAAGVPVPHDLRGWGSLYPKAARKGVIAKHGYGTSLRRNCSPTPMWRSLHPNFARSA